MTNADTQMRDFSTLRSSTGQCLYDDLGRQIWRELEDASPDSGHSQRFDSRFLYNEKRLTDSEFQVLFREEVASQI